MRINRAVFLLIAIFSFIRHSAHVSAVLRNHLAATAAPRNNQSELLRSAATQERRAQTASNCGVAATGAAVRRAVFKSAESNILGDSIRVRYLAETRSSNQQVFFEPMTFCFDYDHFHICCISSLVKL